MDIALTVDDQDISGGRGGSPKPQALQPVDITTSNIVIDRITTFREACSQLPTNDFGLPKFIYRPDLIPEDLFTRPLDERAHILGSASLEIHYREGFPTLDDGNAFWSQLPFETDESYTAFKTYLGLADRIGIRRIEALQEEDSTPTTMDRRDLLEAHTYYFWSPRCKAHDLFRTAANQKLRERRVLSITDTHFLEAEKLLGRVLGYFNRADEDGDFEFLKNLNPKVALDMLDKLVKIQRISVGLPSHGLSDAEKNAAPSGASVEVTLRQIAKAGEDPEAAKSNMGAAGIELLLSDPDTAKLAQELIIKVGSVGSGGPQNG